MLLVINIAKAKYHNYFTFQLFQEIFTESFLDHTAVIQTNTECLGKEFNLENFLTNELVKIPEGEKVTPIHSKIQKNPSDKQLTDEYCYERFLKRVDNRIMGVENNPEPPTMYQKEKTRDAIIEMIDTMVSKNEGKPFRNLYFDEAKTVNSFEAAKDLIKERTEEEEKARTKIIHDEITRFHNALKAAEERCHTFLRQHLNGIQMSDLTKERDVGFVNIVAAVKEKLEDLRSGIPVLLHHMDTVAKVFFPSKAIEKKLKNWDHQLKKGEDKYVIVKKFKEEEKKIKVQNQRMTIKEIMVKITELETTKVKERNDLIKSMKKKGCTPKASEVTIAYITFVLHILDDQYLTENKLGDLQSESNNQFNTIIERLRRNLEEHLENLAKILPKNPSIDACTPLQMIVQEVVHTTASFVMAQVDDKAASEKSRIQWRKQYIQEIEDDRGVLSDEFKIMYCRQLALHNAEEVISTKDHKKIRELASNLIENNKDKKNSDKKKSYSDEIIERVKEAVRDSAKVTPNFFSQQFSEEKVAMDALEDAVVLKNIDLSKGDDETIEAQIWQRRRHRMSTLISGEGLQAPDAHMKLISLVMEFLVDRQFKHLRTNSVQEEYSKEKNAGRRYIQETLIKQLNDPGKNVFDVLHKFPVPEDCPTVPQKIAQQCMELYKKSVQSALKGAAEKNHIIEEAKRVIDEERKVYETKIEDLTTILTYTIRKWAIDYAKKIDIFDLRKLKKKDYEGVDTKIVENVMKDLPEEAKKYFSQKEISDSIKRFAEINHNLLWKFAKFFCFPEDATVICTVPFTVQPFAYTSCTSRLRAPQGSHRMGNQWHQL